MVLQVYQFLKKILYCNQVPGIAPVVGLSVQIFNRAACEITIFLVKSIRCQAVKPVFGNCNIISIITKTQNKYLQRQPSLKLTTGFDVSRGFHRVRCLHIFHKPPHRVLLRLGEKQAFTAYFASMPRALDGPMFLL